MRTWTNQDKTGWGDGPWVSEFDKAQWVDEATGLDCLIVRGPVGALCGYVGVPPEHPWHGISYSGKMNPDEGEYDYESAPDGNVEVHGGLTYSDSCWEDAPEGTGICHIPEAGRPADVWWFGFDTAHHMDLAPMMIMHEREMDERLVRKGREPIGLIGSTFPQFYRTVEYVKSEITSLAAQLAAVA